MPVAEPTGGNRVELAALLAVLAQPWRELQQQPPFAWLTPDPPVSVLHADGSTSTWSNGVRQRPGADTPKTAYVAVEVPPDDVLESAIELPPMAEPDLHDALWLHVRAASPFEPQELVWGWRRAGDRTAVAILSSRRAVEARVEAAQPRLGGRVHEVWAFDGAGRPVVLQGFGEGRRQRRRRSGRVLGWVLLLAALLLAAAALITPTLQLKLRAVQAQRAMDLLQQQQAPAVAQREALATAQAQMDALRALMSERVEPLAVLELLTRAIPDDTFVQRLQVQGSRVTITGQTPNTAALMNRLSEQPLIRDVRAPNAATRAMAGGRENFTIELMLQPEALRPETGPQPRVEAPVAAAGPAASAAPMAGAPVASAPGPASAAGGRP